MSKSTIGVGYSNKSDSYEAGLHAATSALAQITESPTFVLLFCSGKHNPQKILDGVRSVTKNAPLLGGAALGVFTNTQLSYESFEVSVTIFGGSAIQFSCLKQGEINQNEFAAGQKLAEEIIRTKTPDTKGLLVFYDSVKQSAPPMLNFATPLFGPIDAAIGNQLTCAGAGILGDMMLSTSYQFFNDEVLQQHVVAVMLRGNINFYTTILHGCKPGSSYHTITKVHGPVVLEIDDRPALEVIDELLGPDLHRSWRDFALYVTLGVNKGEKFAPYNEVNYANRLCLAVDEASKALVMFEPDLQAGDEFQLMHRSISLNYVQKGVQNIRDQAAGKNPLYWFYINCAGRAKPYAGGEVEDVEELQNVIGTETPFMGFYSGVEVARLGDHLQALDWTGVLCLITEA
jgi:hypothetical protein